MKPKKTAAKKKVAKKKVTKKNISKTKTDNKVQDKFIFGQGLRKYLYEVDALGGVLPLCINVVKETKNTKTTEVLKLLESFGSSDSNNKGHFNIPIEHYQNFSAKVANVLKYEEASNILPVSFLVSMISQFDAFIVSLIKDMFVVKPELIKSVKRDYSISEIVGFSNIDEIKDRTIENKINNILRDSHIDQIKWIKEKADLNIVINQNISSNFVEVTERRNLFVHADGIVNAYYLENCEDANVNFDKKLNIGDKLHADVKYFLSAIGSLSYMAIILKQIVWRKLIPQEIPMLIQN